MRITTKAISLIHRPTRGAMQIYPERIALRLHGRPAQHFNKVVLPAIDNFTFKLGGYSVASVAVYLIEINHFDSRDDAGARYKRGALKMFPCGYVRA